MTTTHGTLRGKAALVTGASRGIGAATAVRLAREGADVALTCPNGQEAARDVVRRIEALGRRAVALRADAADADEAAGVAGRAAEALGGSTCWSTTRAWVCSARWRGSRSPTWTGCWR